MKKIVLLIIILLFGSIFQGSLDVGSSTDDIIDRKTILLTRGIIEIENSSNSGIYFDMDYNIIVWNNLGKSESTQVQVTTIFYNLNNFKRKIYLNEEYNISKLGPVVVGKRNIFLADKLYNINNETFKQFYFPKWLIPGEIDDIHGNYIVGTSKVKEKNSTNTSDFDIFLYNISSNKTILITNESTRQCESRIYENKIVWSECEDCTENKSGKNINLFLYDIESKNRTRITNNSKGYWIYSNKFYKNKFVWSENRTGNYDIYLYDISKKMESQITTDLSNQFLPDIYEDKLVYVNESKNSTNIYLYNFSTKRHIQITNDSYIQTRPKIYGDKIVWINKYNGNTIQYCNLSLDSDKDNLPNYIDEDDDNDGVLDENDTFPFDQKESIDSDGDGIGNNADTDDDNDGFSDLEEIEKGTDPLDKESYPKEEKDYLQYLITISLIIAICVMIIIFKKYNPTNKKGGKN